MKKIVIIDDHPIVRQGFRQIIEQDADYQVIGEAEDAFTAMELIEETQPDMALIDLSLKNSNGLELIKDLQLAKSTVKILVVSLHEESLYAERALRAGARGFIMKAEATENILVAVRTVAQGGIYLSEKMHSRMLERMTGTAKPGNHNPLEVLSDREFEVFQLIGDGFKTKAIAEKLNLSIKTIETYKSHLKTKLDARDSVELLQIALEWSLTQKV